MRFIYLLLFLSLGRLVFAQSTGSIRGTINTSDGRAAEFVHITIEGLSKGTIANSNGEYVFSNLQPGNYTLVSSFVGLQQQKKSVEVVAGKEAQLDFVLSESARELQEIVVSAERYTTGSIYVSKMPIENIENPQVYNVINNRILKEQVVTNFDDALKNAPGVEKLWESTGRGGDGTGYYSMRGFSVQPTLVNGLPGLSNGSLDPANIERIEVIKGPSGTLFGSSLISYGGLINTVTKKPYERFGGEVSYVVGSYGLNRIAADINTRVGSSNNVLMRVNTAFHKENSFQDAGFRNSFVFAPTLSYRVNDRLSFLVLAEFLETEGTNQTMLFLDRGAAVTVPTLNAIGYDHTRSYTSNNLTVRNPTTNLQAQMNYKFSERWSSQTLLQHGSSQSTGYYSYLYEASQYYPIDGMVFSRYVNDQNESTVTTDVQQNFMGDFNLGSSIRNRVVVGFDYYKNRTTNNSTDYVGNGSVYIGEADPQEVYSVVFGGVETPSYDNGILSVEGMSALLANSAVNNTTTEQQTTSAYFSNIFEFQSIGLSTMVSLRFDYFDTDGDVTTTDDDYNQATLSPKFGLLYQPLKDRLSIFANYMDGFVNVAPHSVADADGSNVRNKTLDPEHAKQLEFGVKTNLVKNRLTSTISYYDIKVSNRVMIDPENVNNVIQGGEVQSKGFEFDINAMPVNGLNVNLGYGYNDSEVLEGTPGQLWALVGKRMLESGPKNIFNAWATYRLSEGRLKGLGVGVGANAASERVIMDGDVTGLFVLPAYTIYNASVFYNTDQFRLTLKVDNLTDVDYYKGWTTINPQRPRTVAMSFAYTF